MKRGSTLTSIAALLVCTGVSAVTLPRDYGAVDIEMALKSSAGDGKPIMLLVSAPN